MKLTHNKKYCCETCKHKHDWKLKKNSIENGSAIYSPVIWKRYLIEIRGHKCEKCHNHEWMCEKIPLNIDHIDGDSNNNSLINLRIICPNCHAQTPTFAGRNKGKGKRSNRIDTYKKNKRIYS